MNGRRCSIGQTPPPHQRWLLDLTPPRAHFSEVETYSPGWSKHPFPESKSEQDLDELPNTINTTEKRNIKRNLSLEYARKSLQTARQTLNKRDQKRGICGAAFKSGTRAAAGKTKKLSSPNKDRVTLLKKTDLLPARHTTCSRPRGFFTPVYKRLEERGNRATADKAKELSSQNKDRVTLPKESAVQPLQE